MIGAENDDRTNPSLGQQSVSGLWLKRWASGHHGYQRACDLISGKALVSFSEQVFTSRVMVGPCVAREIRRFDHGYDLGHHLAANSTGKLAILPTSKRA